MFTQNYLTMRPTDFAKHIADFLGKYLPAERGMSENSIKAYRDTFVLLIRFFSEERNMPVNKITLNNIDRELVTAFLDWLQDVKGCSVSTRNARLAALRSFFSFLEYENPERIHQAQKILSIPIKKGEKKNIKYLSVDGVRLLLQQPDRKTKSGRRDIAMLALMYDTGARVQEIADLKAGCVRLEKPYTISITGKGRKTRIVPLLDRQIDLLADYMYEHGLTRPENAQCYLFVNRNGNKITRGGIAYLLQKYLDMAKQKNPSLIPDGISCHSIRHSRAMHLLQADVPLIYIRDLLGHESVVTTEIYAKADSRRKREVLANAFTPITDVDEEKPVWLKNDNLLEWLNSL